MKSGSKKLKDQNRWQLWLITASSAPSRTPSSGGSPGGTVEADVGNHRDQSRGWWGLTGSRNDSGAISVSPPSAALRPPESLVSQATSFRPALPWSWQKG